MRVVWIASFPKSGSTWLRYIANHILFGDEGRNDPPPVRDAVPDIHDYCEPLRYSWNGLRILKTHLPFHSIPRRMQTHSFVYVIRHPLDVLDSALAYLAPSPGDRQYVIDSFCEFGSVDPWLNYLKYGSLEENVKSWVNIRDTDCPHLVFRYEDMLDNPHKHIQALGEHFGFQLHRDSVLGIAEKTSFKSLKKIEEQEIETGKVGFFTDERLDGEKTNFRFMRSGRKGSYRENLTEEEISKLTDRFRPLMDEFNYTSE